MIKIDIRENNRIIILDVPGKLPIRSHQSSSYFHNSMELLCVALGSCIGHNIQKLCYYEKKDPKIFQSIYITIENFKPKVIIQIPENLDIEFKNILTNRLITCEIAQLLKSTLNIEFIQNTKPLDEVVKIRSCCG